MVVVPAVPAGMIPSVMMAPSPAAVVPGIIPAVPARIIPRAVPAAVPASIVPRACTPVPGIPVPRVVVAPAVVPAAVVPGAVPAPAGTVPCIPVPGPVCPAPVYAEGGVWIRTVDDGDRSRVGIPVEIDPCGHVLGNEEGVGYAVLEIDVGTSCPCRKRGGFLVEGCQIGLGGLWSLSVFAFRCIVDSILIPLCRGIFRILRR